jgi:hypothetical protein
MWCGATRIDEVMKSDVCQVIFFQYVMWCEVIRCEWCDVMLCRCLCVLWCNLWDVILVWRDVTWCDVMWCDVREAVRCDVIRRDVWWSGMLWCKVMRCDVKCDMKREHYSLASFQQETVETRKIHSSNFLNVFQNHVFTQCKSCAARCIFLGWHHPNQLVSRPARNDGEPTQQKRDGQSSSPSPVRQSWSIFSIFKNGRVNLFSELFQLFGRKIFSESLLSCFV